MGNSEILRILTNFEKYFSLNGFCNFFDLLHLIGWGIIYILAFLCDGAEQAVDQIMKMGGLLQAPQIVSFYNEYKIIIWVVLAAGLMFVGFLFMLNKVKDRMAVVTNLILAIVVIVAMPSMLIQLNTVLQAGYNAINPQTSSTSNQIVKQNVTDLKLLDTISFSSVPTPANNISADNILSIDINEKMTADNSINKDVFKKKITVDENGAKVITDLDDNWIDFLDEHYYRYSLSWGTIIIVLAITAIVLVFTGVKIARIFFELVVHQFLASVLAFMDIHSGQRLKAVIQSMLSSMFVIFVCAILLKLYLFASYWTSANLEGVAYIIAMVGLAFAVIDGPNVVERILGIDAGLNSAFRTFFVARSISQIATRGGKNLLRHTKTALFGNQMKNKEGLANKIGNHFNNSENNSKNDTNNNSRINNENKPQNNHSNSNVNSKSENRNNNNNTQHKSGVNTDHNTVNENNTNQNNRQDGINTVNATGDNVSENRHETVNAPLNNVENVQRNEQRNDIGNSQTKSPISSIKDNSPSGNSQKDFEKSSYKRNQVSSPTSGTAAQRKNPTPEQQSNRKGTTEQPIRSYRLTSDKRIEPTNNRPSSTTRPTETKSTSNNINQNRQGGKNNGVSDTKGNKKGN